jgi:SAM-dependent methyltransferase
VILDVGSGREPTLSRDERPAGLHYVGLDIAREELARAPTHAYDEVAVTDVCVLNPELRARFDIAISVHFLEHVTPLSRALANIETYLKPGGKFFALVASRYSAHALANRFLPERLGARFIGRPPDTKFKARYDHCSHRALTELLGGWQNAQIEPLFLGAHYFGFSATLQRAFLSYENWAERTNKRDLASHYLISAIRAAPQQSDQR